MDKLGVVLVSAFRSSTSIIGIMSIVVAGFNALVTDAQQIPVESFLLVSILVFLLQLGVIWIRHRDKEGPHE